MRDWGTYRKLYENPPPAFERLPFAVRSFSAEILRRCDRIGRIIPSRGSETITDDLVDDLAFHVRAHESDRPFLVQCLEALLEDGYLEFRAGYLVIRNFAKAQGTTSSERMAKKRAEERGSENPSHLSHLSQPSPPSHSSQEASVTSDGSRARSSGSSGLVDSGSSEGVQGEPPVKCPPDLRLDDDDLASCELDIGMPREDGLTLCKHFAVKWKRDPPRPLRLWQKALWTAVTSSWKDPNQRRKLVRPPGLQAHESARGSPVPDSAEALENARLEAVTRHRDQDHRYATFLEALREGRGGSELQELYEHGDDKQLREEFERREADKAKRKGKTNVAA